MGKIFMGETFVERSEKFLLSLFIGDWSNGMIGVSKTFGGSSILSSPANLEKLWKIFRTMVTLPAFRSMGPA